MTVPVAFTPAKHHMFGWISVRSGVRVDVDLEEVVDCHDGA